MHEQQHGSGAVEEELGFVERWVVILTRPNGKREVLSTLHTSERAAEVQATAWIPDALQAEVVCVDVALHGRIVKEPYSEAHARKAARSQECER